jgi:hypothetical protein
MTLYAPCTLITFDFFLNSRSNASVLFEQELSVTMKLSHYPKAHHNRVHGADPAVQAPRRGFMKLAAINFLMLQALFLALFAYLFGAIFHQDSHTHNMNVLYVDYDGGVIGKSVREAYASLQGNDFPSLIERPASDYATPGDLEVAVCKTRFWAALYTSRGASRRLEAALAGASAATTYNKSDVLTYIWNEARYSTTVDTTIAGNIQTLSSASRVVYATSNGTGALRLLPPTDLAAASISIFADPWQLTSTNIQPTTQGSRQIYNTLVIVLILIQEFFYLGTINGLSAQFKMYERLYPHRIIIYRNLISLAYTFSGSLCITGMIWAFRASWHVNANQFALSWASLWLFAHVNFLTLDVFTVWLPPPYIPMALIAWVVLNVTSILTPFELSSGFYRWAYAMPAHEVFQVLIDIWSRGCNPQLHYALPILFALEVSGLFLSALGVYRRCHYAVLAAEAQEAGFQGRVETALALERKRDQDRREQEASQGAAEGVAEADNRASDGAEKEMDVGNIEEAEGQKDRAEIADMIRKEDSEIHREETRAGRCNFGPSFDLAFGSDTGDSR